MSKFKIYRQNAQKIRQQYPKRPSKERRQHRIDRQKQPVPYEVRVEKMRNPLQNQNDFQTKYSTKDEQVT
jgi:ribosomal protein S30